MNRGYGRIFECIIIKTLQLFYRTSVLILYIVTKEKSESTCWQNRIIESFEEPSVFCAVNPVGSCNTWCYHWSRSYLQAGYVWFCVLCLCLDALDMWNITPWLILRAQNLIRWWMFIINHRPEETTMLSSIHMDFQVWVCPVTSCVPHIPLRPLVTGHCSSTLPFNLTAGAQ